MRLCHAVAVYGLLPSLRRRVAAIANTAWTSMTAASRVATSGSAPSDPNVGERSHQVDQIHADGPAVARRPANECSVRQEWVTGGAAFGRDLDHPSIR